MIFIVFFIEIERKHRAKERFRGKIKKTEANIISDDIIDLDHFLKTFSHDILLQR